MNKSILISIRPKHLVNILNGKKTLELRKSVPKDFVGWVYLYCTKDRKYWKGFVNSGNLEYAPKHAEMYGKVVARFWFDEYGELIFNFTHWRFVEYNAWGEDVSKDLCLTTNEIMSYRANKNITLKNEKGIFYYPSKNKKPNYLWHIKQLEIFDTPKELSDFYKRTYLGDETIKHQYRKRGILSEIYLKPLTKAPQSFRYVYVKGEE